MGEAVGLNEENVGRRVGMSGLTCLALAQASRERWIVKSLGKESRTNISCAP